jgi:guanylate kinase
MQRIAVFIGPSGVGKSAVVTELIRQGIVTLTPSWTTRPRRAHEDGKALDHVFVDEAGFVQHETKGGFMATTQPFGLPYRYGLPYPRPCDGTVPAVILRASLLDELAKHCPNMVVIQIEADRSRVEAHLRDREAQGAAKRQESHDQEVALGRRMADQIIANDGDIHEAVVKATALLRAAFPGVLSPAPTAASER